MIIIGDAAHPMLPHQGQGGAQGIEDGIALGISLSGAKAEDIKERLALFEKGRRHRASAIQVMSNAGPDQAERVTREVAEYVSVPLGMFTPSDVSLPYPRASGANLTSTHRLTGQVCRVQLGPRHCRHDDPTAPGVCRCQVRTSGRILQGQPLLAAKCAQVCVEDEQEWWTSRSHIRE